MCAIPQRLACSIFSEEDKKYAESSKDKKQGTVQE